MISEAIKPIFKVGQKITSPAGHAIIITRIYNSDGTNMYHFNYTDTGKEGYHALFEQQLVKAN